MIQNKQSSVYIERFLKNLSNEYLNKEGLFDGLLIVLLNRVNTLVNDFITHLRRTYTDDLKIDYKTRVTPSAIQQINKSILFDVDNGYGRTLELQDTFLFRVNRFNGYLSEIKSKINRANSVISAISLNAEDNVYQISDSFNDTTLINENEKTLNIDEEAGVVTLPITASTIIPINKITILETSNGFIADIPKNKIDNIFDSNYDSWFQYERQLDSSDSNPLIMELLIKLSSVQPINFIKLVPLILDEKTFPRIQDIQVSVNGQNFESVFNELPPNVDSNELEEYFTMGPVGLRNQEYSSFYFTPRAAGYVKIRLTQSKKQQITNTVFKQKIALSEIIVGANEFAERGIIASRPLTLPFIGRRFYIEPKIFGNDTLADVGWEITVDGGTTWLPITPFETLEINTGSANSVVSNTEKNEIIVRFTGQRNESLFNGLARPLAATIEEITERIDNAVIPFATSLNSVPIQDSLKIFTPIATVGHSYGFEIAANFGPAAQITLPLSIAPLTETIRVNGYPYARISTLDNATPNDKVYTINYIDNKIEFGDGLNGYAPDGPITMTLEAENILLPDISPFIVELEHPHNFSSKDVKVLWVDKPTRQINETLPIGANEAQLSNYPLILGITAEDTVPAGVNSFWLTGIPVSGEQMVFTDKTVFTTRVERAPIADGEYQIKELDTTQKYKPVNVITYTRTNPNTPGQVFYKSEATIKLPQTAYTANSWDLLISQYGITQLLEVYKPVFSDLNVYKTFKQFIDGSTELEQDGDYSINLYNGKIYSFTNTSQTGTTSISYTYQKEKILNWKFTKNANEILIDDNSFLVNENNDTIVLAKDGTITYNYVYKDNRFIRVPVGATSPYTADGVDIEFTSEDFVRGYLLPSNRNKIKLPNKNIVKNSIRFLFLSNDINAYDDRTVEINSEGDITITPLPVKDIYGNILNPFGLNNLTQRDIDKTTLVRERNFVDGFTELEAGGDYSIDYKNGILYTYTPTPAIVIAQYKYSDVRVSYVATQQLQQNTNFTLNPSTLQLKINSANVNSEEEIPLIIKYEIISELKQSPQSIVKYYSPVLMGYTIKARPV